MRNPLVLIALTAAASVVAQNQVQTSLGPVNGIPSNGTVAFRGIPFAAPPTGSLRWLPPQPPVPWTEPRDGSQWAPLCPQTVENDSKVIGQEDCLQLNLWTPNVQPAQPLPVIVWIHGGGFAQGGASTEQLGVQIYDGSKLAAKTDSVVVAINYRLGPLGYLAHSSLSGEFGSSGNLGTLDQIAALRWVQTNVHLFGGDPTRVAIYGESAGGVSVCTLLATRLASGLFHAAGIQSGGCPARSLQAAEDFGARLAKAAGCETDTANCLRGKSVEDLLTAVPAGFNIATEFGNYGTVVDGTILTQTPLETILKGEHSRVPILVGSNSDETSRSIPPIGSALEYQQFLRRTFPTPGVADLVLRNYPVEEYASPRAAAVAVTSDSRFICPSGTVVEALRNNQQQPVYRYFLTFTPENANPLLRNFGAWHGLDVLYLFDRLEGLAGYRKGPKDAAVVDTFAKHWGALVANAQIAGWPVSTAEDPYLEINAPTAEKTGVRTRQCQFWNTLIGR